MLKKVLLIAVQEEGHQRLIPLGVAYIASYLIEKGYDVRVYDPPPYEKFNAMKVVDEFRPDIISISCMTPTIWEALNIAKEIKSKYNIPIVFGGIHVTSVPEEVMQNENVDYAVYGEGELTMHELLQYFEGKKKLGDINGLLFRKNGKIIKNKQRELINDLDSLPWPRRDLFSKWYFMRCMCIRGLWLKGTSIMTSRGCAYGCTYCASKVMFGRRVRFRSAKNVVDEIEHLLNDYKLEAIWFADDTFTVNKKLVKEVCNEINRRNLKFKWGAQVRVDCVDEEVIKLMKDTGCVQFDIGVESGSEKVLKRINKGITPTQIREAFRLFKKYNMRTCATFMVGTPDETEEDIKKTAELVREINPDYSTFFITTPYPGTPMYEEIKDQIEMDGTYREFRHGGPDTKSLIKNTIPHDRLMQIQGELTEEFLKGSIKDLLLSWRFWADTALLIFQRPSVLVNSFGDLFRTKRITEFYRALYYAHNLRR